jgi:hypothetical protein
MVDRHKHNGTDSEQIEYTDILILGETTIADPSGGLTTDSEARTAINAILDLLQAKGLMK